MKDDVLMALSISNIEGEKLLEMIFCFKKDIVEETCENLSDKLKNTQDSICIYDNAGVVFIPREIINRSIISFTEYKVKDHKISFPESQ